MMSPFLNLCYSIATTQNKHQLEMMEKLIAATPSGDVRNKLTDINMELMKQGADLRQLWDDARTK